MPTLKIEMMNKLDFKSNEAFKRLRTNIEFCGSDIKVITFTSCTPNEGKSTLTFNSAVSFAEAGKRILFIDADLRKSVIVGRYKINDMKKGFSHFLCGQSKLDDVIYTTNVPNLDVIIAGPVPPNPSELLGSTTFSKMLEVVREEYDYVFIDAPPLGSVIDSAIIARQADGAILVIESEQISYKFAQKVVEDLNKSNCRILGTVLNKVNMTQSGYYGKYYGKSYGRYYGDSYGETTI